MKYLLLITILFLLTSCFSNSTNTDTQSNLVNTSSLLISGYQRVNQTVTAVVDISDENGISNAQVTYQWFANNTELSDETNASIALESTLLDQSVHLVASFTDDEGFEESFESESFDVIQEFQVGIMSDSEYVNSFSRSTDDGQTWGVFAAISTSHIDEYHYEPSVTADAQGNLVAVSMSDSNPLFATTLNADYDIVVSYSHDSAETWSEWALINPSDTTGGESGTWSSDGAPKIVTDGNGVWMVAWHTGHEIGASGLDDDVFVTVSQDNGVTWISPSLVNNYGNSDSAKDISVDLAFHNGRWFAVWGTQHSLEGLTNTDFDVILAYSDDNGASWSEPLYISDNATTDTTIDGAPQIAFSEDGNGIVTWSGVYNGTDTDVYAKYTNDGGNTWSTRKEINDYAGTDTTDDYVEDLAFNDDGVGVIAWSGPTATTGDDKEPQMSFSNDGGGTWEDSFVLYEDAGTDAGEEYYLNVTAKPSGGWIFSWVDNDTGNTWIRHTDDLETWESSIQIPIATDESIELFYY